MICSEGCAEHRPCLVCVYGHKMLKKMVDMSAQEVLIHGRWRSALFTPDVGHCSVEVSDIGQPENVDVRRLRLQV